MTPTDLLTEAIWVACHPPPAFMLTDAAEVRLVLKVRKQAWERAVTALANQRSEAR